MQSRLLRNACLAALSVFGATCVHADDASSTGNLEEVLVTAQKRVENVQRVPIAIAALGGDALQERGIREVSQLGMLTPSVQMSNSSQIVSSPVSLSAFIRGIGQDDFSAAFEPGVGTYLDGVYLARTVGANANLLDVDRVEILKGPQGTLFGRNTIGGAINVVTRTPGDEASFKASVTTGRFGRIGADAAAELPIVSGSLLSSVAVSYNSANGFQRRVAFPGAANVVNDSPGDFASTGFVTGTGSSSTLSGGDDLSARGKLLWRASDALRATLTVDYARANDDGGSSKLLGLSLGTPTAPTLAGLSNVCINTPVTVLNVIGLGPVCGPRVGPGTAIAGANVNGNPATARLSYSEQFVTDDPDETYSTGNNFSELRNHGVSLTLDYDLSDAVALKSITAYRDQEWTIGLDLDGSPVMIFEPSLEQNQHQFSQELQLTGSSFADRLKWVAGAYYFEEGAHEQQNPIFAAGLFTVGNPIRFHTQSVAVFTHFNYQLTDRIGLTAGARYTEEDKKFWPSQLDVNLFLQKLANLPAFLYPDPTDLRQLLPTAGQKQDFSDFSPRLGFEYTPTDDMMLYASFSRGYKSGGWTTRVTAPVMDAPTFDEETAETYEIGLKSDLLDGRLRVNAALFTTDYEGMQILIQRGISPTFENAGNARIKGVELEAEAVLTNRLRLAVSAGMIDAKYTEVDDPTGTITLDSDLPKVAEWTAHVGPEYRLPLGESTLILRADYSYRSRVANDAENTPQLYGRSVNLVDASATWQLPGDSLELIVGGTNVFDKRYLINGTNQLPAVGPLIGVYNRPAEWYITARYRF